MATIKPVYINASGAVTQAGAADFIPVAYGGTGLQTLVANSYLRAVSSSAFELRTPAQVLADIGGGLKVSKSAMPLNQDGTVPDGYFTTADGDVVLGMTSNTTGSTGFPTEFGATLSVIMSNQAARSFDLHMPTNSANFLYYRGYSASAVGTEWKTIASLQNPGTWTALQAFNAGWRVPNNQQSFIGTGGGTLRGTDTGSVVLSSGTSGSGYVFIRPNGDTSTTYQTVFYANGNIDAANIRAGASVPNGDGSVVMEFAIERSWQVRQKGTGATTSLELYDVTGGKKIIMSALGTANVITFDPNASNVAAATFTGALVGNASTATSAATLTTARTINGTSFNGSANITTSLWGTARNLTIGTTAKSVNGSANVAWTLAEIGAPAIADLTAITDSLTNIAGDNQVGNGNFALASTAGWTSGNSGIGSGTANRTIVDSALSSAGKAYRMDIANLPTTGRFEIVSNSNVKMVRVEPSKRVQFTAYTRGTAGARIFMQIRWNDEAGQPITYTGTPAGAPWITAAAWEKKVYSAVAPATAVSANVYVCVYGLATTDQWFETTNISLQGGDVATGYAPSIDEIQLNLTTLNNITNVANTWTAKQTFALAFVVSNERQIEVGTGGATVWGNAGGSLVLSSSSAAGNFIYFRPNGASSAINQSTIDPSGLLTIPSISVASLTHTGAQMTIATSGRIQFGSTASSTIRDASTAGLVISTAAGTLFLRAGGDSNTAGQLSLTTTGLAVGGNTIWHAGNFTPTSKLDTTGTAAAATKLATARTINGVSFDGTANITITAAVSPNLYANTVRIQPNAGDQIFMRAEGTTGVTIDAVNSANSTYAALSIRATTIYMNGPVAASGDVSALKFVAADAAATSTFAGNVSINDSFNARGVMYFGGKVANTGNKVRIFNPDSTVAVRIDAVNAGASAFTDLEIRGLNILFTGSRLQNSSGHFNSTTTAAILSAENGVIYLRPNGRDNNSQAVSIGTDGVMTVSGSVQLIGNGRNIRVYDNNADTACVDIGSGIGTGTDRGGYVINRNAAGNLLLAGRNMSVKLQLGPDGNYGHINQTFVSQPDSAINPNNMSTLAFQSRGSYGGGYSMRDDAGAGLYWGGMFLASGQMYLGVGGANTTGITQNFILKSDGQLYLTGNQLNIEGTSPTIRCWDSDEGITSWIHNNGGSHGFLQNNAYAWACYRNSGNDWVCQNNIIAYASDERLKKNIVDAPNDIIEHFFENVRIRQFDWDEDQLNHYKVGIKARVGEVGAVAQEMQRVYADAVAVNEAHNQLKTEDNPNPLKPNFLTIDWTKTVPLLIAEIQNLRRRVKQLENRP